MKRLLLLVALAALGCGTVRTYRYPLSQQGAPASAPPAVFFEGTLPSGGMQELAMVEAVGTGTKADTEDVVRALQEEGARWGASAVVRVRVDCAYGQCHGYGVAVRLLK